MLHHAGLAMHDAIRTNDSSAKCSADGLMSKAHTEDRNFAGESFDDAHRFAGALRRTWTRRNHDSTWPQVQVNFFNSDLIVSSHFDLLAQLTEILNEVVGERIVVVYYQEHCQLSIADFDLYNA